MKILFFAIPMLMSIPFTAILCRWRIARHKQLTGWMILAGALIAPVLIAIAGTYLEPDFWSAPDKGPRWFGTPVILGFVWCASFCPAGLVVANYERKRKRDSSHWT
jgi:polyferredoxin